LTIGLRLWLHALAANAADIRAKNVRTQKSETIFRERARLRARARTIIKLVQNCSVCKLHRARARKRARSRNIDRRDLPHLHCLSFYIKSMKLIRI
jgi:hypothetical protein